MNSPLLTDLAMHLLFLHVKRPPHNKQHLGNPYASVDKPCHTATLQCLMRAHGLMDWSRTRACTGCFIVHHPGTAQNGLLCVHLPLHLVVHVVLLVHDAGLDARQLLKLHRQGVPESLVGLGGGALGDGGEGLRAGCQGLGQRRVGSDVEVVRDPAALGGLGAAVLRKGQKSTRCLLVALMDNLYCAMGWSVSKLRAHLDEGQQHTLRKGLRGLVVAGLVPVLKGIDLCVGHAPLVDRNELLKLGHCVLAWVGTCKQTHHRSKQTHRGGHPGVASRLTLPCLPQQAPHGPYRP